MMRRRIAAVAADSGGATPEQPLSNPYHDVTFSHRVKKRRRNPPCIDLSTHFAERATPLGTSLRDHIAEHLPSLCTDI